VQRKLRMMQKVRVSPTTGARFHFAGATCEASSHEENSACQPPRLAHVSDFRVQR